MLVLAEVSIMFVNPRTISRAEGCLLGQLVGDSLGSLVEFQSPKEIARNYPEGVRELADGEIGRAHV